jgi:alanine-glyoxylate transaminase/serine-glyoxylate transaminase/serine-pyruvate transaminase
MLCAEGLDEVFARHRRFAEAARLAVGAWGLEVFCLESERYSPVVTAVLVPEGHDANRVRQYALEDFDLSLGVGLAELNERVFRIGHLGHFNELCLVGTLAGVELGLRRSGIPLESSALPVVTDLLDLNTRSRGEAGWPAQTPDGRLGD